jgi:hypothetical protein
LGCSASHPKADKLQLFILTNSLKVSPVPSWHNELRFFIYGSLSAFLCLGRLPGFKVAALKIAGNGCGVQVWLKGAWWPSWVCVCARMAVSVAAVHTEVHCDKK